MNQTSISNISVIINSKVGLLRDNIDYIINDFESWLNNIINQTKKKSQTRTKRCEVCNSREDNFEGHHISGRKHDYRQITCCKPCHRWLSDKQKTWDKRWEQENLSDNLRLTFFLMGLHDILSLKSKKSESNLYEKLAMLLIEEISQGLKA
ncbi:MAG: hypothetical protein IIC67_02005 [Thaumarchaeota archaeon]|nr:hypothetical protein [Nitrososphaerota archaeon]